MSQKQIDWDFIIDRIGNGKFAPVIGNGLITKELFGGENIVVDWAEHVQYPLSDKDNLSHVAQFLTVIQGDPSQAKSNYLRFLNRSLIKYARQEAKGNPVFLDEVAREARRGTLSFSELATERLKYPNFAENEEHPLSILASLDIPVYLTTGHHLFIENALKAIGKCPKTQVYSWWEGMTDNLPDEFRPDLNFEPTVDEPLVYHLHGIDSYADSLVLTQSDYLEFMGNVLQDITETDIIPNSVRNTLSTSLLGLLGFDLHTLELETLLHGLVKPHQRRSRSFAIQIMPDAGQHILDTDQFRRYLENYFSMTKFNVYWGDAYSFTKELLKQWQAW